MQHMPDKDFDKLFRDKFIDAEIEPSANLWDKIETQLAPKPKRILPIYWVAAASVAIAFTAMLAFQKTEKIQLRLDDATVAVTKPVEQELSNTIEVTASSGVNEKVEKANFVPTAASSAKAVSVVTVKNNEASLQPIETLARLPIKQADPKPIDILPVVVVENPIVIAQVDNQQVEPNVINETDLVQERKGFRNVGDLVNYVVDKVDKRDKKIVRFNTDDDDNSSIVGINIGFLKFNKKNK
ncbi:hypothetical protein [Pedobacter insulae]|uniref:Uncharacterized protein n=1 Tax=Pedobacter insulae TaxID=414048 RepID=A0A1I2VZE0_9SPHI|nr:hypothetical protein [Pedobacter insulae]SFG93769.1 hypothetical protein SAMN04489864_103329 [Pedobacter insulae]